MSCFKRINKAIFQYFTKKELLHIMNILEENLIKEVIRCGGCGEKIQTR